MRSQTRSSFSTLVFLIPLLGVPLMAIFGVPQFVPVIASSVSEEASPTRTPRRTAGIGESASASSRFADSSSRDADDDERLHDLFRSTERSRRDSRPIRDDGRGRETKFVETSLNADTWLAQTSSNGTTAETTQPVNDLFGNTASTTNQASSRSRARASTAPTRSGNFATRTSTTRIEADAEQSNEGLTWRDAVRQLNELGIQEFRLEPGRKLGEFYFACEFAPDRDARITRRFEAEAKEPLLAVAAVLRQIDEWLPRR